MCAGGALHWITAGAGRAETRGQASALCAAKRRRFVPEVPAAQWNELRALFVDKSQEIRFLRKHATHSIAPQARKQSFACHFAALVFMDYPRVPTTSSPAVIQCSAPPEHGLKEAIADGKSRIPNTYRLANSIVVFRRIIPDSQYLITPLKQCFSRP